jgi:peptidoglycan L-alanyl-D-glutamate endopeptidase CwlK
MITSRKLSDLHPKVEYLANKFVLACAKVGIDVIITSTFRDDESQNNLYAQGRTKAGKKVTNAKGGESFHNYKLAFDFAPVVNGKCCWNDKVLYQKCGEIAEGIGLEWAGRWKKFNEMAHCQYTGGLTIADLKNGRTLV